jgi:hypothetical protein
MSNHGIFRWRNLAAATGLLVLAALLAAYIARATHQPNHEPADKHQVAASDRVILVTTADGVQTILSERIRASRLSDWLLNFTTECGIRLRQTDGPGPESDSATARVRGQVRIDNEPVSVVAGPGDQPPADDGWVTLCSREFTDTEDAAERAGVRTEDDFTLSSNAFNWVKLDVGNGLHEVTVHADFEVATTGVGTQAEAQIGKRTLLLEPTHMIVGQDKRENTP